MQLGAVLSQQELGTDVAGLRAYAQAVQDLGYDFLVGADHVVGADPAAHPDLPRVYPLDSILHERSPSSRSSPASRRGSAC